MARVESGLFCEMFFARSLMSQKMVVAPRREETARLNCGGESSQSRREGEAFFRIIYLTMARVSSMTSALAA